MPSPLAAPHRSLLALLAPPRCLACRRRGRIPWCVTCAASVRPQPPGCPRCAAPRSGVHACWPADAPIDGTVAAFDYRGEVALGIATAKLAGAHAGWAGLSAPLVARLAGAPPPVDVVTWVTTPAPRVRERGIDHAAVIAGAVARGLGLPVLALLVAVERGRAGDDYLARHPLPGTDVLLVDDIVTTGATAWRAATELRRAGAGAVHLAVLARAGTHALGGTTRRQAAVGRARSRPVGAR
ncbi:MAG: phosphoribosyltransferase family protein [Nitriliruptoraceae bacterium]